MRLHSPDHRRNGFFRGTVGLCAALVAALLAPSVHADEEYLQLRGAGPVRTTFSSGSETIEQIAHRAESLGIDVVVFADSDLLAVEYGIPFLRNLTLFGREEPTVLEGRLRAYLNEIGRVRAVYPELVLLDGVESAPFYYWDVELIARRWVLRNWDRHIVAVNLQSEEAYRSVPVLGSDSIRTWGWASLLMLWPLLGLAYVYLAREHHPALLRLVVLLVSVPCLIHNFPYKAPMMSAYSGDLGSGPYQNYIDHVNAHGGMAFWPHLGAASAAREQPLVDGLATTVSYTPAHPGDLLTTRNYTGFLALGPEDGGVTLPGAEWDRVLQEYLREERAAPVWVAGGLGQRRDQREMDQVLTVFLVDEPSSAAVLEAMQLGRMYAADGGREQLLLARFAVDTDAARARAGEAVDVTDPPAIHVAVSKLGGGQERVKILLIRSGEVITEHSATTPHEFTHVDQKWISDASAYYRVTAESATLRLVSNPIFVRGGSPGP